MRQIYVRVVGDLVLTSSVHTFVKLAFVNINSAGITFETLPTIALKLLVWFCAKAIVLTFVFVAKDATRDSSFNHLHSFHVKSIGSRVVLKLFWREKRDEDAGNPELFHTSPILGVPASTSGIYVINDGSGQGSGVLGGVHGVG